MHITIHDLELWVHIGTTEEERSYEQRILVKLTIDLASCDACKTDKIGDTVDYNEVVHIIKKVSKGERSTIEKLSRDIADAVLAIKEVKNIEIAVNKFAIPGTGATYFTISCP